MSIRWDDLFSSGSVVDITISQWSGRTKIQPADFGIKDSEAVNQALSLGHHRMVPRDAFDTLNIVIRDTKRALVRHGIYFPFIRGARFVPAKNLTPLVTDLKTQKELFDKAVELFITAYEKTVTDMRPIIWQALNDASDDSSTARDAMMRIDLEYPDASVMRRKFAIKWNIYSINGPVSDVPVDTDVVKDVLKGMVSDLRGEITTKLGEIMKVISKGGKLQKRSIESAKVVLDRVESVSIFGDKVLTQQIRAVRKMIEGMGARKASNDEILGIEQIKGILEKDIDSAVADAEQALIGVGQRKIQVP